MKTYCSGKGISAKAGILSFFCIALLFHSGKAQTIELVKDINPAGASTITNQIDLNGVLLFAAYEPVHGSELWRSDGTDAGTVMIKDINPGTANANVMNPVYFDGKIYFSADNGTDGREIWVTDGNSAGTYMVKDINPSGNGSFSNAIVFNNLLFFNADDGIHGNEWWTTDGTFDGTQLFADNSSIGGGPENPYIYNNKLYFAYSDGINGREPWMTDGTPAGTTILLDINQTNSLNSLPDYFTDYNGLLYFSADDGVTGTELWVTDGTSGGTQLVKDIRTGDIGSSARNFIAYNSLLYFEANDGINGVELWASNGTDTGTFTVKDLNTAGSSDLIGFFEFNNQLFFSAIDGSHGREPWMSDGSADGTQLLLDINPAGNSMPGYFNFVMIPKVYDGKLYFVADEGTNGYELWFTDGSATGTQIIEPSAVTGDSPLNSSNQFEISGDAMYFDANYDGTGEDLYRVVTGSSGIYYANSVTGKVEVYPNPSSGNFQIKFTSSRNADVKIAIFNVLDEKIWEKIILMKEGENSLSFADHKLEPGIYFLTLTDNKNKITRKIFIQ